MNDETRFFSPAETARRLNVSTKALRLYEALGLIAPLRTHTGWRTYGPHQMARLHQVLALKSLGVPLKRIAELLDERLADLDAILRLQEAAFRSRIAGDRRRLQLLASVRRRIADGETLSVEDLINLTRDTVIGISKTHDAFAAESEAMAVIEAAGFHPLAVEIPPETNENHWHDFDSIIFVLEGELVVIDAESGDSLACGPGSRIDFPRGILHHEDHKGYRALIGFSVDPTTLKGPLNLRPEAWAG
ncbi:MerR family transcriptional regulator [Caulobacter sp. KR2-114]|uniref:MerR family transcriptional regulator n=1 Tax=Caulobacter sp. KR2-114 TaxID=3400912 RepID=UPI003C110029